MINEENLNKMYEAVIDGKELTTKELNSCGFNSKDLTKLVENSILERVKRGSYSFNAISVLIEYGKRLMSNGQQERANACFKVCHKLKPYPSAACMQLFINSIQDKDYEKAFEYFKVLNRTTKEINKANNNFYLYLLNYITDVPKYLQNYVRNLSYEDFKDKRVDNLYLRNRIKISASNQRFKLAIQQCMDIINNNKINTKVEIMAIKILLEQTREEQKRIQIEILNMLKAKNYVGVVTFLGKIKKKRSLSELENNILILIDDLCKIINLKIIPLPRIFVTDSTFEAIEGKNYELAFALSSQYNIDNNRDNETDNIHIVLTEINNEISKLKAEKEKQEIKEIKEVANEVVTKEETEKRKAKPTTGLFFSNLLLEKIFKYLINQDLKNAIIACGNYLESINKREYSSLMEELLKISLMEEDKNYTKLRTILTEIRKKDLTIAISEYIQKFNETVTTSMAEKIGSIAEENKKANIEMNISEFKEENNKYFGMKMEDLKKIAEYLTHGKNIEEACENLGFDIDKKCIVLLIIAQEYYTQGKYAIGDQYLKKVEQTNNKSKFVISLWEEVRKNKKYYINRTNENQTFIFVNNLENVNKQTSEDILNIQEEEIPKEIVEIPTEESEVESVEQEEKEINPPLINPCPDTKEEKTEEAIVPSVQEEIKDEIEEVTAIESMSSKKEVEATGEKVGTEKSAVSEQGTGGGSKKKKKQKKQEEAATQEKKKKGNNTKKELQTQRNWLQDAKVLQYKAQVYDEYSALYGSVLSPDELENITNNAFLNYDFNEGISMELSVRFKMETDILVTLADKYRQNPDSEEALNSLIVIENIFKKKIKEKYPHYEEEKIAMAIESVFASYTGEKAFFVELALKLRN